MDIKKYIQETKEFYEIQDFKKEILDFQYGELENQLVYNLGHPLDSHKGKGIGDLLAYTQLPRLIKEKTPNAFITLPLSYEPFYRYDPYVDDFQDKHNRWGSLGTWGTTFQRSCNVWNIKSLNPFPIIYLSEAEKSLRELRKKVKIPQIIISTSSFSEKSISVKGIETIVECVQDYYEGNGKIIQVGITGDIVVGGLDEYHFNVKDLRRLINIIASADLYIGIQNGISHIAKGVGTKSIIIVTYDMDLSGFYLPYLTQINELETNMLSEKDLQRKYRFIDKCKRKGIRLNNHEKLGWLYADNQHLFDGPSCSLPSGTERCPQLDYDNLFLALNDEIYPYQREELWDLENHSDKWIGKRKVREKIEVKGEKKKIGVQILSYNRPEYIFKTIDSLLERQKEDKEYEYKIVVLEQSDDQEKKYRIVSELNRKYKDKILIIDSPNNLGQRGGSNLLWRMGFWNDVDYWMNTDHDNLFHKPLSIYCKVLDKYKDCYIASGYHSPEHDTKRIEIDKKLKTMLVKSTARFGHHVMRKEDYLRDVVPADEKCSCGGAIWFAGNDWWISHWSPNAPGKTLRNSIGFIYCIPGAVEHIGIDKSTWLGDGFEHPEYSQSQHEWTRKQKQLEIILEKFPNRNIY